MNEILLNSQSSSFLSDEIINKAAKDPETRNNKVDLNKILNLIFKYIQKLFRNQIYIPNKYKNLKNISFSITNQIKLLSVYAHKFSIILLPKTEQIMEWHGMISISYGLYAKGKFKFVLNFPKSFPESIPKIRFLYPLFHPLIDEYNNVDVDALIPKWKYGQDCMVYNLLNKLYEMFIDVSYYDCVTSFNPQAAQLFSNDINSYAEEVKKQVAYSEQQLYNNKDDFVLKLKEPTYNTQAILSKLQDINSSKNLTFEQKKKDLLNYILQQSKENKISQ